MNYLMCTGASFICLCHQPIERMWKKILRNPLEWHGTIYPNSPGTGQAIALSGFVLSPLL